MNRFLKRLFALIWISSSLLFAIAVLEVLIRMTLPQGNAYLYEIRNNFIFNRPYFSDYTFMQPSPKLVNWWENWRSPEAVPGEPGYSMFVKINGQGFRSNDEQSFSGASNRERILLLGDSIAFGWTVPVQMNIAHLIEKKRPNSEVINCSVIGSYTKSLERIYQNYCVQFSHEVLVLQMTLGVARAIPDYLWADFMGPDVRIYDAVHRFGESELIDEPPQRTQGGVDLFRLLPEVDFLNPTIRSQIESVYSSKTPFYSSSHLARVFENRRLALADFKHAPAVERATSILSEPGAETLILSELAKGNHPTLKSLRSILEMAKIRGVKKFILQVTPTKYFLELSQKRPDVDIVLRFAEKMGWQVLPLQRHFSDFDFNTYYWKKDGHPNAQGYELIADDIVKSLNTN